MDFWSAINEAATEAGDLIPLLCENDLAQERYDFEAGLVDTALLQACAAARTTRNRTLVAKGQLDGVSVRA
jgi:hypothetical protein